MQKHPPHIARERPARCGAFFCARSAAAASLDNAIFGGRIGSMRERKKAKSQKIGLSEASNSGINTRIMRATPLPAAVNTNRKQTT